ncbi:MAG: O-antigen ligase family protein [Gammaproteobacteria bacterium]|nr:O-antigen ligase family protein [Gammaproteobacteria bacterium]
MWQSIKNAYRQQPINWAGAVLLIFILTVYLSTALAIAASCMLGLVWLTIKQYNKLPGILKNNATAAWALALYICFFIGLGYSSAPSDEAFSVIRKYRELTFIPLIACFFTDDRTRLWAWRAFVVASVITLIGSYLMDLGLLDMNRHKSFSLKSRITHSIFIAFFMFYCGHKALDDNKNRILYGIALLLGTYNLFFVVEGRTGQLVLMLLVPLFAGQRFGKKGLLCAMLAIILFATLFIRFSDKLVRIQEGFANTLTYLNKTPEKQRSSMGRRYLLWENSAAIIAEKPLLGHGTGGFAEAYEQVVGNKKIISYNPHNEFLLIAAQLGLAGLCVYLGFLYSQYRMSKILPDQEKWLAQGMLLTLMTTSLFNSPFLDHTEGHWFAVMIPLCLSGDVILGKPT